MTTPDFFRARLDAVLGRLGLDGAPSEAEGAPVVDDEEHLLGAVTDAVLRTKEI